MTPLRLCLQIRWVPACTDSHDSVLRTNGKKHKLDTKKAHALK